MLAEYAEQYERLWNQHWWWQARKRFVGRKIARLARRRPLADILDIGCGNGLFFDVLARHGAIRGIEPDAGLVRENTPWRDRIEVCPFGPGYQTDRRFDLILMLDVLEHIEDDRAAARRAAELLNPGGFFLLTVPALMSLWSIHDEVNLHFRRYTKSTLRPVVQSAGLELLQLRYFFAWTIAPMILRRLLSPPCGKGQSEYHVNVPPAPINGLMYALSVMEQATFACGGLPLGSSLIAIARKPPLSTITTLRR